MRQGVAQQLRGVAFAVGEVGEAIERRGFAAVGVETVGLLHLDGELGA